MKRITLTLIAITGFLFTNAQINLVKDIYTGSSDGVSLSSGVGMIEMNNVVYFVGTTATEGAELWRSDGTTAGTYLVKDINPGSTGSNIRYLYKVGNTIFMHADDGTNGSELWKTDGTTGGTSLVKNINTNSGAGSFYSTGILIGMNNKFIFVATLPTVNSQLWISDGTAAGTTTLSTLPDFAFFCRVMGIAGQYAYFLGLNNGLTSIFRTDGTGPGTILLQNATYGYGFNTIGTNAYYAASTPSISNYELWTSDGSVAGTTMVKDIYTGTVSSLDASANFIKLNNKLYFGAQTIGAGNELWVSDGTAAGTTLVKDILPGINSGISFAGAGLLGIAYGNKIYFTANDGNSGQELWSSDGTTAGTQLLKDINPGWNDSYASYYFPANYLYFTAGDGSSDIELFRTDGTPGGTMIVKDINPGPFQSNISGMIYTSGGLYFSADNGTAGNELWRSDGTSAGTNMVLDLNVGGSASPQNIMTANNYLIMNATTSATGRELYAVSGIQPNAVATIAIDNAFTFYPNPSNGEFIITGLDEQTHIQVFDLLGKEVVFSTLLVKDGIKIKLEGQPSGVYFLKAGTFTKKIVKE